MSNKHFMVEFGKMPWQDANSDFTLMQFADSMARELILDAEEKSGKGGKAVAAGLAGAGAVAGALLGRKFLKGRKLMKDPKQLTRSTERKVKADPKTGQKYMTEKTIERKPLGMSKASKSTVPKLNLGGPKKA